MWLPPGAKILRVINEKKDKSWDSGAAPVPTLDLSRQFASIREEVLAAVEQVCISQHYVLGEEVERVRAGVRRFSGRAAWDWLRVGNRRAMAGAGGGAHHRRRRGGHDARSRSSLPRVRSCARGEAGVCGYRSGDVQPRSREAGNEDPPRRAQLESSDAGPPVRAVRGHDDHLGDRRGSTAWW